MVRGGVGCGPVMTGLSGQVEMRKIFEVIIYGVVMVLGLITIHFMITDFIVSVASRQRPRHSNDVAILFR